MKRICVAGLNPSWQKTIVFESFTIGAVNRSLSMVCSASGKGINFARAVGNWGKSSAIVCQFAGGSTGVMLNEYLENEGIKHCSIQTRSDTRVCSTLTSEEIGSPVTEVIEPSPVIESYEHDAMMNAMKNQIASSDALAICGTFPAGLDGKFYAELASEAGKSGKFVFVDSYAGIEDTLSAGVDVLKINLDELRKLTGHDNVDVAFDVCFSRWDIGVLAITDGPGCAYLASSADGKIHRFRVPRISHVTNPIGSGDTCSGVMLSELLSGTSPVDAFKLGLAAASANCLTPTPACFERDEALRLAEETVVS